MACREEEEQPSCLQQPEGHAPSVKILLTHHADVHAANHEVSHGCALVCSSTSCQMCFACITCSVGTMPAVLGTVRWGAFCQRLGTWQLDHNHVTGLSTERADTMGNDGMQGLYSLMLAAKNGHVEVVKWLLSQGAHRNASRWQTDVRCVHSRLKLLQLQQVDTAYVQECEQRSCVNSGHVLRSHGTKFQLAAILALQGKTAYEYAFYTQKYWRCSHTGPSLQAYHGNLQTCFPPSMDN